MIRKLTRAIIFDSSTLISFAMNGILDILAELKKNFKGKFILTSEVRREVIDRPITMKKFKLEALKIQGLVEEGVLETPESVGVTNEEILKKTNEILEVANTTFMGREKDIKLISSGEASCLALSKILGEKNVQNVIAIDERTMRMLIENPENLGRFLQKKMHTKIDFKRNNFEFFEGPRIIRSAELVYIAYKKKLVKIGDGKLLDALLWAVKLNGCSISSDEIAEIKKIK